MAYALIFLYITSITCNNLAHSMLNLINNYRSDQGLKHLKSIQNLENAARDQALYMCENSSLTHTNPGGDLEERAKKNGFKGSSIGENIAKNHSDNYEDVAKMWMKSDKHRKNIMGGFNYTGVATCLDKKGSRFWVQVFGKDIDERGENEPESSVSLDDKSEPNQYNSVDELIEPDLMNRKLPNRAFANSLPYETNSFCFKIDECMQVPSAQSTSKPVYSASPQKITRLSIRTSFVPISSLAYSTVFRTLNHPASVLTVTKTASMDGPAFTSTQTIVVVTASPVDRTISSTVTVTKTITTSDASTSTKSQQRTSSTTAEPENTVTITKTISSPATNTVQLERTVTVTATASKAPERKSKSARPNIRKLDTVRPKLIQLVPEREDDYGALPLSNEIFDPSDSDQIPERAMKRRSSGSSNRKHVPYYDSKSNKSGGNKNIEHRLRRLLQGMGLQEEPGLRNDINREFLNDSNCGTPDNPCVKAYILRE
ncbi:uncharacterized protein VICG_01305 [Vittaforma corneae ATCC 50505]|uniref:SCP domain-containing protein n=1 Tax=Vittaforma corneae (strain ATCC 50505) TaxID=993615 RepID=L2GMZ4_VITCO|nr:uncharacterized protein VICG_01305 [Vittaforma corneae ATCC 50505]ELA41672.1 hypothetical protein VICG_01305 [Vittaforma corneae ATCC 50505]